MTSFYKKMYQIFQPAVAWVYRVHPVGSENVPEGGVILAANHTSFADVLVLSAASKRQLRYMAKKELFKIPLLAPLIKALGAYPVDRGGSDVGSLKKTIAMLEEGEMIGIFPQGHRHGRQDPRQTEIKHGVGMKEDGGTVTIATKETDTAYEVIIKDDGVGFDPEAPKEDDGRSHVGMENTKKRLHDLCGARVEITSVIGEGTTAKVILPKEGQPNENHVC